MATAVPDASPGALPRSAPFLIGEKKQSWGHPGLNSWGWQKCPAWLFLVLWRELTFFGQHAIYAKEPFTMSPLSWCHPMPLFSHECEFWCLWGLRKERVKLSPPWTFLCSIISRNPPSVLGQNQSSKQWCLRAEVSQEFWVLFFRCAQRNESYSCLEDWRCTVAEH